MSHLAEITVPFLTHFSIPMQSELPLVGEYCDDLSVWVSEDGKPIILTQPDLAELRTKTQTLRETDD